MHFFLGLVKCSLPTFLSVVPNGGERGHENQGEVVTGSSVVVLTPYEKERIDGSFILHAYQRQNFISSFLVKT